MMQGDAGSQQSGHTFRKRPGEQSQLVGREREMERLHTLLLETERCFPISPLKAEVQRDVWMEPVRETGAVLCGEAGLGKTRLAEELHLLVQQRGWTVIWSRAYAQGSNVPYNLWRDLLRYILQSGLWPEQAQNGSFYRPLIALLHELADVWSVEQMQRQVSPSQDQLWEAILGLLQALSETAPLLIILDDIHLVDQRSAELFGYLLRRLGNTPVLVLATCREYELNCQPLLRSIINHLQRERLLQLIRVEPLLDFHIEQLVAHLPRKLRARVQHLVRGNPFFAEELGRLAPVAGVDEHLSPLKLSAGTRTSLPATITAVFEQRLRRLSEECQTMLKRAAVLDGPFSIAMLCAMENPRGACVDEEALLGTLEEALQAKVLVEEKQNNNVHYSFWHPLLCAYLYEHLSAARRASYHRKAVMVIQQMYQGCEEEGAGLITYHLVHGRGDEHQIAYYAEMAGDYAYRLAAYIDAEKYYTLALEQSKPYATRMQFATLRSDEDVHVQLAQAFLHERLGECRRFQGNAYAARQSYEQALLLRQTYASRLSQDDINEVQVQALLWNDIGITWYDEGEMRRARHCCEQAENMLRESGITEGSALACLFLLRSYICWREGAYQAGITMAREALILFGKVVQQSSEIDAQLTKKTRLRRTLAGDPVNLGRTNMLLGMLAVAEGHSDAGVAYFNAALELYERHHCLRETAILSSTLGDIYLRKTEYGRAEEILHHALTVAERIGDYATVGISYGNLGILASRLGTLEQAEVYLRQGVALAEQAQDRVSLSAFYTYLARVLLELGKLEEAIAYVRQALLLSHAIHCTPSVGSALVALGMVRLAQLSSLHEKNFDEREIVLKRLLRTKKTIQRLLDLPGLDVETHIEGLLLYAHILLWLQKDEEARQTLLCALTEAKRCAYTWLELSVQSYLGCLQALQGEYAQACACFFNVAQAFQHHGMQLEYARTLRMHGATLVRWHRDDHPDYHYGMKLLLEARECFHRCGAAHELRSIERLLAEVDVVSELVI